jgi:hypothetical protein
MGGKAAARRIERAAAPALSPSALAEAEARARAAEAELLALLNLEEPEAAAKGESSGKGKGKAKGKAKVRGGKSALRPSLICDVGRRAGCVSGFAHTVATRWRACGLSHIG